MPQTVYHHLQLSVSGAEARKLTWGRNHRRLSKDPRLKQQKLDLEQPWGGQYITLGSSEKNGWYGGELLKDIRCPDKRVIIFLQMTSGNGLQAGLAGIVEVDRRRIQPGVGLEIIGDEQDIVYDQDYKNHLLPHWQDDGFEYRIPIIPVPGTRVNFKNIVPYKKTKPLGWNSGRTAFRMKKVPNQQQMVELKDLLLQ